MESFLCLFLWSRISFISFKPKSNPIIDVNFTLLLHSMLEMMVDYKQIVTTSRQVIFPLIINSFKLLCSGNHYIIKKPTKLIQIPCCNRNFSNQSMQSICRWAPTFTKCFHKIFIEIICEQGSKNSFIKVGSLKKFLASTEYVLQPFPI